MPTHCRILALLLAACLVAACGSTGARPPTESGSNTVLPAGPNTPGASRPGSMSSTGTTDPGSRYASNMDPFGAIAVETDPLADVMVPVAAEPAAAPRPDPLPAAVASPAPARDLPPAGPAAKPFEHPDGRREYQAPAPPPPPDRWTTPSGGR